METRRNRRDHEGPRWKNGERTKEREEKEEENGYSHEAKGLSQREDVLLYQCKWDASVFPLIQIAE